jgi:serine/threonine-protein kinase
LATKTFGKYELLEHLGGGMADVYRARDAIIGKIVVVKILRPEHAADPDVRARFLDEARTVAALDHPHVVNVFDFGEAPDGRFYMIMEYLRGQDLRTVIKHAGTTPIGDNARLALQIAESLEYTHSQGVIHRDIKPENIHVDDTGVVRLIDFGIAKSATASLKTSPGFAVGTVFYMSPEQVRGQTSKMVDIYAFGLVLYEMLTGARAVQGTTHEDVFRCILTEPVNLEPLQRLGVPKSLQDLICRCTAKDSAKRPQSFTAVCNDLRQIIAELPASSSSSSHVTVKTAAVRQPLGRRTYALIAFGVVSIAAVTAYLLVPSSNRYRGKPPIEQSAKKADTQPAAQAIKNLSRTLPYPSGEMVLVPAGEFLFGEHKERRSLPDFYIDKTEVTNEAYSRVLAKGAAGRPDYPVVNVTVEEARNFCEVAGKRLPTMYEWEKAARGSDGRDYPWGDQTEASAANVKDNRALHHQCKIKPADSFPIGASPCGALNMAGNVWEFVSDSRLPTKQELNHFPDVPLTERQVPWPMIYGGGFYQKVAEVKSWDTAIVPPNTKSEDMGFRCAKTP